MKTTRVLRLYQVQNFIQSLPPSPVVFMLLGGDRISCCDEGVAVEVKKADMTVIAGIATIAPKGETGSGQPTIVGVYVRPEYRRRGFAVAVTEAAIRRCQKRGFARIRVDVVSAHFMGVLAKLGPKLRKVLDVHDCGSVMDLELEKCAK